MTNILSKQSKTQLIRLNDNLKASEAQDIKQIFLQKTFEVFYFMNSKGLDTLADIYYFYRIELVKEGQRNLELVEQQPGAHF